MRARRRQSCEVGIGYAVASLLGSLVLAGCAEVGRTGEVEWQVAFSRFKDELPARRALVSLPATPPPPQPAPPGDGAGNAAANAAASTAAERTELLDAYKKTWEAQLAQDIERRRNEQEGYKTRTAASVVFLPRLHAVQPALIQSFSLRNFIQAFNSSWDPTDLRNQALREIIQLEDLSDPKYPDLKAFEVSQGKLSHAEKELLARIITEERLKSNYWFTRSDVLSFDIGLAPSFTIGKAGERFDSRVDTELPQFIFGGGFHYGGFEISAGTLLFREIADKELHCTAYFGISIDLFQSLVQLTQAPTTGVPSQ